MALFDNTVVKPEGKAYIALLNKEGEMVAFVQPAGKVEPMALVEALADLGLNVELREPKAPVSVELI